MFVDGTSEIERGRIDITLRLEAIKIGDIVEEDVRKIEQLYFDPFVEDNNEIAKKINAIERIMAQKQDELDDITKRVDFIRSAEKSAEVDKAKLIEEWELTNVTFVSSNSLE